MNKSCRLPLAAAALVLGAATSAEAGVVSVWTENNILAIEGSADADAIVVSISGTINVYEVSLSKAVSCSKDWASGVTTTVTRTLSYDASAIDGVAFFGMDGNDYFRNDTGLRSFIYGGAGIDVLIGSSQSDLILGDYEDADTAADAPSCNVIYGNGDDDYLAGGLSGFATCDSQQYIYGGDGPDYIGLGKNVGTDTSDNSCARLYAEGGSGADHLYGGTSADDLYGGDGNDVISAGEGMDLVAGGDGEDTLDGGLGDDWMYGDDDNDLIHGDEGDDDINGGYGQDGLYGDAGEDLMHGDGDADWVHGGDDDDELYGDNGADKIYGEGGNDYMSGGSGNDKLWGGSGGTNNYCKGGSGTDSFSDCNYSLSDG